MVFFVASWLRGFVVAFALARIVHECSTSNPCSARRVAQPGQNQRSQVVFAGIEVAERQELGIRRPPFPLAGSAACAPGRRETPDGVDPGRAALRRGAACCVDRRPRADARTRRSPSRRYRDRSGGRSCAVTKAGTSSGTSQLVTYAVSTAPGSAFKPARRPSNGPRPSRSSRTTVTSAGNAGSDCSGAATTTMGETAVPRIRTTRCSMVSGPKASSAFDVPIRVDRPPQSTIPRSSTRPSSRAAPGSLAWKAPTAAS